jgi:hypothetical protein
MKRSKRNEITSIERLQDFREKLLRRYGVKTLNDLPPGPQQDFWRAAEKSGVSHEFVAQHFGSEKVRTSDFSEGGKNDN